jgi:hypothetical protein
MRIFSASSLIIMMELELALPGDRFHPQAFRRRAVKGRTLPTAYTTIYGSRLLISAS